MKRYSSSADMGVFLQMLLNGGTYGGTRILSNHIVSEMTRNQIPGVPGMTRYSGSAIVPEGSWGYGWTIAGRDKWPNDVQLPIGAFNHRGGGASFVWADPGRDLLGVFLSVCDIRVMDDGSWEPVNRHDLFVNAVTAALM